MNRRQTKRRRTRRFTRLVCIGAIVAWASAGCGDCRSSGTPRDAGGDDAAGELDAGDARDAGEDVGDHAPDTSPSDASADAGDLDRDIGAECDYEPGEIEEIPTPDRLHTPRWAFMPWISKDISDAADTYAFVEGFQQRDIPVGVVVLDSPWEDNYNTFIPNPDRYPDFGQMVTDMRDRGVRTILWITQFTNSGSFDAERGGDVYVGPASNFEQAMRCGFFVNEGEQYFWWKGRGGSIDFFDPVAVQWWHEQQDALLDLGIAGWKLDFGDSYVTTDTVVTDAGPVPHQEYSEAYYRDFYEYGIHRLGHEEFVTMVRGWDESYEFEGRFFARPEHAPIVWAGDNRRDWFGLGDALDHMFRSAEAGYVVVGSDLGGYLDVDDESLGTRIPFDRTNFLRWLAASAMSPYMQLHGRGNLTPWSLPDDPDPDESVALYRYWAHVHTELIPFWYSLAVESYAGRAEGILRPVGGASEWAGDYRYMLGDAILVAPILDETGTRQVELPAGWWYDWWTEERLAGETTQTEGFANDLQKIPLYVREGAILPIDPIGDETGFANPLFEQSLVVLAWPSDDETTFALHPEGGDVIELAVQRDGEGARFSASSTATRSIVRLRHDGPVGSVTVNGTPLAAVATDAELASSDGYRVEAPYVWISAGPDGDGIVLAID